MNTDARDPQVSLNEIFCTALGRTQIGPNDSFFDCGGDSITAMQALFEIAERFSVELSLHDLVENPTSASLAAVVLTARAGAAPLVIGKRRHAGWGPATADQERNWLSDTRNPARASANFSLVLELSGALDPVALEQAVNDLERRHEPLRTSIRTRAGAIIQVIHPFRYRALKVVRQPTLDGCNPAERDSQHTHQLIVRDLSRPFYLSRGPLVRWTLYALEPQRHVLAISVHQIVCDGVSIGLLLAELSTRYRQRASRTAVAAEPLAIQLADYAEWEKAWLAGSAKLAAHLDYWRATLTPPFPQMALAGARPRSGAGFAGDSVTFSLDAALTHRIRAFCTREHITTYALFMSVFCLQLHERTQESDLIVATQVGRRSRAEARPIIGKLAGLQYVRTRIDRSDTPADVLRRVSRECVGLVANEDMPCSRAISLLNPGVSGLVPSRVMLVMLELAPERVDWAPLSMKVLPGIEQSPSEFDLSLFVFESAAGFRGKLEFNASEHSKADMTTFLERLVSALGTCTG